MLDRRSDEGVSSALTAMFVIAAITLVYSTIVGYYMPQWSKAEEYHHLREMEDRFITLQSSANLVLKYGQEGDTVSIPVKMGSITRLKSMEIMEMPSTAGVVKFNQSTSYFNINMTDDDDSVLVFNEFGTIRSSAYTTYYPQRHYIYQGGAVIKQQNDVVSMVSPPDSEVFVARGTINSNSTTTYYYTTTTPSEDYAEYVEFRVPGKPGDITVSYEVTEVDTDEVAVYLNGEDTGIRLTAHPGSDWSSASTFTFDDDDFLDGGINIVRFVNLPNTNTGSPYLENWGIRNVKMTADFVRVTLPSVTMIGKEYAVGGLGVATVTLKNMGSDYMTYRPGDKRNYTISIRAVETYDAWLEYFTDMLESSDLGASDYTITTTGTNEFSVTIYNVDEISIDQGLLKVGLK